MQCEYIVMIKNSFDDRIQFLPDLHIMEVDFSNMRFDVSGDVHVVYDVIDSQLEKSGRKWFFLINYLDNRIMAEAWIAFAHRGKQTNLIYSLGSARYAASGDTSEAILGRAKKENFDPNLFLTRDEALTYLGELCNGIPEEELQSRLKPTLPEDSRSPEERIIFHFEDQIMEVDYSDYSFATSNIVNSFYDELSRQLSKTDQKWYFLVNYANTEILPEAWYAWSIRGKQLNLNYSLGTVRFDPRYATKQEILRRARADEFKPNVVSTREEALERINEMKHDNEEKIE